jgi:hypothetical protein
MIQLIKYMVYLTMVNLTILELILAQLPIRKLIKTKTNHN